MAPLFSKVNLNKLRHDVQNEETLICAKFGKDPFNISKVIGCKKWPNFFDSQCRMSFYSGTKLLAIAIKHNRRKSGSLWPVGGK